LLAWLFLKLLEYLTRQLGRRFGRYRLYIGRFFPVARLFTWLTVIYLIIVHIFKPDSSAYLALTASAGIAIGLAAQDIVKNVISGVLIIFDQPFRIGDMIKADGHYGEVISIGPRSVRIRTFDDNIVTLPNALLVSNAVSNSNAGELDEMVVVEIALPAHVDVTRVKQLAGEAAACSPYVYLRKPISVLVDDEFDGIFLTRFKIKAYVLDVRLERVFASDVIERLKKELVEQKIVTEELAMTRYRNFTLGEVDLDSERRLS